jgi:pilus assembly protein CpaD
MSSIKRLTVSGGLCALALVSACATQPPAQSARIDAPTPLDQHQIKTHNAPDQVGLTIHAEGLSSAQHDALAAFAGRWRAAGGAMVTLQIPSDAPDPDQARTFALAAQSTLAVFGVPYDHLRTLSYIQGAAPKPLMLASFTTVVADAPDCASVPWGNLSAVGSNAAYDRFGCTLAANLASQIADPGDLRGQGTLAPGDNARRMQILGNYRTGKVTASEKDSQASGAVSATAAQ